MDNQANVLPQVKLLAELQYPSLEDCWAEGYEQVMANHKEEDNPYPLESREHHQWNDGWWAGFYGEKPLYILATEPLKAVEPAKKEVLDFAKWWSRFLKLLVAIAVSVACYELLDLAV